MTNLSCYFVEIFSFCLFLNKYEILKLQPFMLLRFRFGKSANFEIFGKDKTFMGQNFSSKKYLKPKYSSVLSENDMSNKEFSYWCFFPVFSLTMLSDSLLKFLSQSFHPCLRIKQKRRLPTLFRRRIFYYHFCAIIVSVLDIQNMQILSNSWSNNA